MEAGVQGDVVQRLELEAELLDRREPRTSGTKSSAKLALAISRDSGL